MPTDTKLVNFRTNNLLYERFKRKCGPIPVVAVFNEFMRKVVNEEIDFYIDGFSLNRDTISEGDDENGNRR